MSSKKMPLCSGEIAAPGWARSMVRVGCWAKEVAVKKRRRKTADGVREFMPWIVSAWRERVQGMKGERKADKKECLPHHFGCSTGAMSVGRSRGAGRPGLRV